MISQPAVLCTPLSFSHRRYRFLEAFGSCLVSLNEIPFTYVAGKNPFSVPRLQGRSTHTLLEKVIAAPRMHIYPDV
jgi:hypothetical protein